jgi:hypothetical protein
LFGAPGGAALNKTRPAEKGSAEVPQAPHPSYQSGFFPGSITVGEFLKATFSDSDWRASHAHRHAHEHQSRANFNQHHPRREAGKLLILAYLQ